MTFGLIGFHSISYTNWYPPYYFSSLRFGENSTELMKEGTSAMTSLPCCPSALSISAHLSALQLEGREGDRVHVRDGE